MRFILGILLGYAMRGKKKLLITVLAALVIIVFVVLPTIALSTLAWTMHQRNLSRPAQTRVPSIKGLTYETAEARLRASNLKIAILARRSDQPLPPGLIVDQVPFSGQEVDYGYVVGVTVSAADLTGP